jgi:hypothetical protein
MPQQVRMPRYVSQRNSSDWDSIIKDLISAGKWGEESTYFGIATEERAQEVYRKLRTAATHQGVARKVFWYPCKGCDNGGRDCRFHVSFTIYDLAAARAYRAQQQRGKNASYRQ